MLSSTLSKLIRLWTTFLIPNSGRRKEKVRIQRTVREVQAEAKYRQVQGKVEQAEEGQRQMIAKDHTDENYYINLDVVFNKPVARIYQVDGKIVDYDTVVEYVDETRIIFAIDTDSHNELVKVAEAQQIHWKYGTEGH